MDVENQNFVPLHLQNPTLKIGITDIGWERINWVETFISQMIHGTRTSMFIGFLSMLLALIPAFHWDFLGVFGNRTLKMNWANDVPGYFQVYILVLCFPLNHHWYYYGLLFLGLLVFGGCWSN